MKSGNKPYTEVSLGYRLLLSALIVSGIGALAYGAYLFFSSRSDDLSGAVIQSSNQSANTFSNNVSPAYASLNAKANNRNFRQQLANNQSVLPSIVGSAAVLEDPSAFLKRSQQMSSNPKEQCTEDYIRKAREAGVSVFELRCHGCSLDALKQAGFNATDLANAGFSASALKEAGFDARDLKNAGFSVAALKAAGFNAKQLLDAGVSAHTLKANGFRASDLLQAGVAPDDLLQNGFSRADLLAAGVNRADLNKLTGCQSANDQWRTCDANAIKPSTNVALSTIRQPMRCDPDLLLRIGYSVSQLKQAGYNEKDLMCTQMFSENPSEMTRNMLAAGFDPDKLTAAGALQSLIEHGKSVKDLLAKGFSCGQIARAGGDIKDLLANGCSVKSLVEAGVDPETLRKAGVSARELVAAGVSPADLLRAGFTPSDLLSAGVSPSELKQAGVSAASLLAEGVSPEALKKAGFTSGDIVRAGGSLSGESCSAEKVQRMQADGVSVADMLKQGCSVNALQNGGISLQELKDAGVSAADLKAAGFSASQLKKAGFSASDLKEAGFSAQDLRKAGFTRDDLAVAGFSPEAIQQAMKSAQCNNVMIERFKAEGLSIEDMEKNGCTASQLKQAGFTADQLKAAGFSAADLLKAGFTPDQLRAAGFSAKDLKAAGLDAKALRNAGFTAQDLKKAGFTSSQLKKAGFNASQLLSAGFSPSDLRESGFTATDLKNAGLNDQALKAAGFSANEIASANQQLGSTTLASEPGALASRLLRGGFNAEQLKNAGMTKAQIAQALCDAKSNGTTVRELLNKQFTAKQLYESGCFSLDDLKRAGVSEAELSALQPASAIDNQKSLDDQSPVSNATSDSDVRAAEGQTDAQQNAERQLRELEKANQKQAQAAERNAAINRLADSMTSQYRQLVQTWSPSSFTQAQVLGTPLDPEEISRLNTYRDARTAEFQQRRPEANMANSMVFPAGTIEYATLRLGINTDVKTPVLATIETGPLRSYVLMGEPQLENERLVVKFNRISGPGLKGSQTINAQAIDAETAQGVVNGSVNRHILQRYGLTLLSSFIYGYGNAYATYLQNATQPPAITLNSGSGQDATVTASNGADRPSTSTFLASSLQQVGSQLNTLANQQIARIPEVTIKVPAGKMIGVVLQGDLTINQ